MFGKRRERESMFGQQISRYEKQIEAEEKLADAALTPEIALAHHQVAMLYKTELSIVRRKRAVELADTLAATW